MGQRAQWSRRVLIGGGAAAGAAALGVGASFAGMGSARGYAAAIAAQRRPLAAQADARELVRYATLAANGHNTQPWRFTLSPGMVTITPDLTRRTPAVDPDDHHLYVSLGCAAENLALAAAARGLVGEPRFESEGAGRVVFAYAPGAAQETELFGAIPRRQSARALYDGRALPVEDVAALGRAGTLAGVDVALITEPAQRDRLRDLVIAGNSAQMADPAFMAELRAWMRFNPGAALGRGDGIYSASSGNPTLPDWLGPTLFDVAFQAEAENDKYARQVDSSAGLAVLVGAGETPAHWFDVGRACQRLALQATARGAKLAFVNQPVEVAALRAELAQLIGMSGRRPDLVLRFGYGPDTVMSPRRPVEAVLEA